MKAPMRETKKKRKEFEKETDLFAPVDPILHVDGCRDGPDERDDEEGNADAGNDVEGKGRDFDAALLGDGLLTEG